VSVGQCQPSKKMVSKVESFLKLRTAGLLVQIAKARAHQKVGTVVPNDLYAERPIIAVNESLASFNKGITQLNCKHPMR
jgi:hypothetical protein